MRKKNKKKKHKKKKDKNKAAISLSSAIALTSSIVSLTMFFFQKFPDTLKLLGITFSIIYLKLLVTVIIVPISVYALFLDKKHSYSIVQKILITLGAFILIGINFASSPNVIYQYTFEPNDKGNACWQIREDGEGNALGNDLIFSKAAHIIFANAIF